MWAETGFQLPVWKLVILRDVTATVAVLHLWQKPCSTDRIKGPSGHRPPSLSVSQLIRPWRTALAAESVRKTLAKSV